MSVNCSSCVGFRVFSEHASSDASVWLDRRVLAGHLHARRVVRLRVGDDAGHVVTVVCTLPFVNASVSRSPVAFSCCCLPCAVHGWDRDTTDGIGNTRPAYMAWSTQYGCHSNCDLQHDLVACQSRVRCAVIHVLACSCCGVGFGARHPKLSLPEALEIDPEPFPQS
jgi:hypothetical protein